MDRRWNTTRHVRWARLITASAIAVLATLQVASPGFCADDLTMAEFQGLHQLLQVPADKPWRTIRWKTSMLDAQRDAARQKKPIFVWAMDGHPLGCT